MSDEARQAALRAALPAEPPSWFEKWWIQYTTAVVPRKFPAYGEGRLLMVAYRALRAAVLGEGK